LLPSSSFQVERKKNWVMANRLVAIALFATKKKKKKVTTWLCRHLLHFKHKQKNERNQWCLLLLKHKKRKKT
jgi:hypothetical protein